MLKNQISKILLFTAVLLVLFNVSTAQARQGCCSRHGGVCGCGCCDGSSLSATCAPYYPECNNSANDNYVQLTPRYTPPTQVQQTQPVTNNLNIEKTATKPVVPVAIPTIDKKADDGSSAWNWIIGLGTLGGLGYWASKRNK